MAEIPLTKGRVAIVDDIDYDTLSQFSWQYHSGGYATTRHPISKKIEYMHRLIMSPEEGMDVDHINRDRLDNRRSNLRVCTRKENLLNARGQNGTSKYKGVSLKPGRKKPWRARISLDGKQVILGDFLTEEEAAFAYDLAAKEHHGEFAFLNEVVVNDFIPFKPRKQTSKRQGVSWCNTKKRWRASIKNNGKSTHLGYFKKVEDAINARVIAEQEIKEKVGESY